MQWFRLSLSVIFSYAVVAVGGEVLIKIEPRPFQMNVNPNTGISS